MTHSFDGNSHQISMVTYFSRLSLSSASSHGSFIPAGAREDQVWRATEVNVVENPARATRDTEGRGAASGWERHGASDRGSKSVWGWDGFSAAIRGGVSGCIAPLMMALIEKKIL
jgi:hypothetical protein